MTERKAAAGREQQDPVVEIRHLRKRFGTQLVLDDFSMNLYPEENLVVLGKSGSGKSVLIKCIVRLLEPDGGSIRVFDREVTSLGHRQLMDLRRTIGFLFQSGALYDSMTVRENLEFPLSRLKVRLSEKEKKEKVAEALENVGLAEAVDKMPSQLSGGMRKRISLARTIITGPKIMLYDEPTTGLDPVTSEEISLLILSLQKKLKTASVIITHDIECARIVANRLVMLHKGKVYKESLPGEFEDANDPLISAFFKTNQF